jgi:hypothetical protein
LARFGCSTAIISNVCASGRLKIRRAFEGRNIPARAEKMKTFNSTSVKKKQITERKSVAADPARHGRVD